MVQSRLNILKDLGQKMWTENHAAGQLLKSSHFYFEAKFIEKVLDIIFSSLMDMCDASIIHDALTK